jgi:hypothetical protein
MSYNTAQKVTPIEMLPELEDLERGNFGGHSRQPSTQGRVYATSTTYPGAEMLPPGDAEKFGRYIRGNHAMPNEAGMTPYNQAPQPQQMGHPPMEHYGSPIGEEPNGKEEGLKTFNMPANTPSCLDVAEHIANCPICSKFYNNDKTIYIISIFVLIVIVILLLKRVLDI